MRHGRPIHMLFARFLVNYSSSQHFRDFKLHFSRCKMNQKELQMIISSTILQEMIAKNAQKVVKSAKKKHCNPSRKKTFKCYYFCNIVVIFAMLQ